MGVIGLGTERVAGEWREGRNGEIVNLMFVGPCIAVMTEE